MTFFAALWSATGAEKVWGKDSRKIVIDEGCGLLVTLLFLPKRLFLYILAFVIFRFLDIVKPPPARDCEKLEGGLGVTLDDVVAGIYANIILQVLVFFRIL